MLTWPEPEQWTDESPLSEDKDLLDDAGVNLDILVNQRPEDCSEQNNLRIDFNSILPDLDDSDRAFARQYLGWDRHEGVTELKGGCVETCKVEHGQDGVAYVYFRIDVSDISRGLAATEDVAPKSTHFHLMYYPPTNQTIAAVALSPRQFARLGTECYTSEADCQDESDQPQRA